jgi:hypothetical protein
MSNLIIYHLCYYSVILEHKYVMQTSHVVILTLHQIENVDVAKYNLNAFCYHHHF